MMKELQPSISIVGAGPGDPELLTIRALKRIQRADVVLYDALLDPGVLELAPQQALKVFVGKRAGKKRFSQETIQQLMVQYALTHGHVVRLKGGDPFVFGRGYEELAYARAFGIEPEIVPGISSAISVPGLQGVPVTSRGYSEGFWVTTGTTKSGQLSKDIRLAAKSTATVVILMGMRKLEQIVQLFEDAGQSNTPVMVISSGSRKNEAFALGRVYSIVDAVRSKNLTTPGIIVIGSNAELHPAWDSSPYTKSIGSPVQNEYHGQYYRA